MKDRVDSLNEAKRKAENLSKVASIQEQLIFNEEVIKKIFFLLINFRE